jgi:uncharacterized protein YukE
MANNRLEILLTVVDEASAKLKAIGDEVNKVSAQVKGGFESAGKATVDFGKEVRSAGKIVSQAGMQMSFFGAALTGPFILAIKDSATRSTELAIKVDNLKARFQDIEMLIAQAVVPIVDRFSNIIFNLTNLINSLNPEMVNAVLQATFLAGIFLTLVGVTTLVIGKIIALSGIVAILWGNFMLFAAANAPLLIIAGSIALLITLMFRFQAVSNTVMSTFEVLFLLLRTGFDGIVIVVETVILSLLTKIQWLLDMMARIPGPTQAMFQSLADNVRGVTDALKLSIESSVQTVQTNVAAIDSIFQTGTGNWAMHFDNFKSKVTGVVNSIKGLGTDTGTQTKATTEMWNKQATGLQGALGTMNAALQSAAAQNKAFAIAAKVTAIGLAIVNTAVGVTNALAVPPPWFGMALAVMIGIAGAIQIATIAATPMAKGGIVTGPTHALIGEAGPEAVIPLSQFGGRMGNNVSINIEINNPNVSSMSDIDTLTEEISRRLNNEIERL